MMCSECSSQIGCAFSPAASSQAPEMPQSHVGEIRTCKIQKAIARLCPCLLWREHFVRVGDFYSPPWLMCAAVINEGAGMAIQPIHEKFGRIHFRHKRKARKRIFRKYQIGQNPNSVFMNFGCNRLRNSMRSDTIRYLGKREKNKKPNNCTKIL